MTVMQTSLVGHEHIDRIVTSLLGAGVWVLAADGITLDLRQRAHRDRLGGMWLAANMHAAGWQNPALSPEALGFGLGYAFRMQASPIERVLPVAGIKLLKGLEWNCAAAPDWDTSPSRALIIAAVLALVERLPGYDGAEWLVR